MQKLKIAIFISLAYLMCCSTVAVGQSARDAVSGAEVTGTFRMNFQGKYKDLANELKIQALGRGKLRIAFDLVYPYTLRNGEITVNMGSLDDEASITGDTAIYESDEFSRSDKCVIKIKFVKPGVVKVEQSAADFACGFGHNVTADGTYRKVSGKKPKFDD